MANQSRFDQGLEDRAELERALASLVPRASQIDRDRFLFLAGQASAEPGRRRSSYADWAWPAATLVSSTAAVVLFAVLVMRPEPGSRLDASSPRTAADVDANELGSSDPIDPGPNSRHSDWARQTVIKDHAANAAARRTPSTTMNAELADLRSRPNYLRLRSFVLAHGVSALPEYKAGAATRTTSRRDAAPWTQRALLEELLELDRRGSAALGHPAG
jgi:hypothetical protein